MMRWSEFLAWFIVVNFAYAIFTSLRSASGPAPMRTPVAIAMTTFLSLGSLIYGVFGGFDKAVNR